MSRSDLEWRILHALTEHGPQTFLELVELGVGQVAPILLVLRRLQGCGFVHTRERSVAGRILTLSVTEFRISRRGRRQLTG